MPSLFPRMNPYLEHPEFWSDTFIPPQPLLAKGGLNILFLSQVHNFMSNNFTPT
ncbi:DUF4058 family protein [Coleofasciculus sp. G1-WW12-02]|uniref:DUF4058 family protein n=1 Tax=Coleofasciculus sp. G1-WW12-02 TaxID=3068483 RepID=UPI0040628A64